MESKGRWVPCKCPVCPEKILGFKADKDLVHHYCVDCDWTFRFNRRGKVLSKHKGKLLWYDHPPYINKEKD